jgi:hypothetical protein
MYILTSFPTYFSVMVSKSEHLPEDGQAGPKHAAIDVILMLF